MVERAFCRAAVNSDFSANVELSTPYRLSSDLSSESFIDEISGRSVMICCADNRIGAFVVGFVEF